MKIEGNSPNAQVGSTSSQSLDRSQNVGKNGHQSGVGGDGDPDGDRVDVSPDAKLMGQAVKAAQNSPAIRQDKVEQARQKLAAGQVGNNPQSLANKMIDHFLGS